MRCELRNASIQCTCWSNTRTSKQPGGVASHRRNGSRASSSDTTSCPGSAGRRAGRVRVRFRDRLCVGARRAGCRRTAARRSPPTTTNDRSPSRSLDHSVSAARPHRRLRPATTRKDSSDNSPIRAERRCEERHRHVPCRRWLIGFAHNAPVTHAEPTRMTFLGERADIPVPQVWLCDS